MAQPVTNLAATWLPTSGIQLSWTAASDVSAGSVYEIYVLQKVLTKTPQWVQVGTSVARVGLSSSSSSVVLTSPAPSFFYPWSAMQALFVMNHVVAPNSLAFSVIHVDSKLASSSAVSVSAYPPSPNQSLGAPHLPNSLKVDGYGSFVVHPQDSYEEIADCVGMFLGTIPGQRTVVPYYGTPDLPLSDIDAGEIQSALNTEEPRALATVRIAYDDNSGSATLSVSVQGGERSK